MSITTDLGRVQDVKTVVIDEMERVYGPIVHIGWLGYNKALCGHVLAKDEVFALEEVPGAVCSKCTDILISLYSKRLL